jgi:NTE family protein
VDLVTALAGEAAFARTLVRAFGPSARRWPTPSTDPLFGEARPLAPGALAGKRIGVVASGGSGATAALCGVKRAFEEAGIEPVALSACSGSALFASLWACGLRAEEMAAFWFGLRTRDYVDPAWGRLLAAPLRGLRGLTGLLRGGALEHTYRQRLGHCTLRQTRVPLSIALWNLDRNGIEYLSTGKTPDVEVAHAARAAISMPVMAEAVRLGEHRYGDGGIVDIFPVQPMLEAKVDLVIGLDFHLGRDFAGEPVRQLGERLVLLQPVAAEEVRGARFYTSFLDRGRWPHFMQLGHAAAREALARLAAVERRESAPRMAAAGG